VADEINKNFKEPYVVLGDFNMIPEAGIFQDFYKKLKPKYASLKPISQGTWPSFFPKHLALSIDHVFSNMIFDSQIGESAGSDHRAILIEM